MDSSHLNHSVRVGGDKGGDGRILLDYFILHSMESECSIDAVQSFSGFDDIFWTQVKYSKVRGLSSWEQEIIRFSGSTSRERFQLVRLGVETRFLGKSWFEDLRGQWG